MCSLLALHHIYQIELVGCLSGQLQSLDLWKVSHQQNDLKQLLVSPLPTMHSTALTGLYSTILSTIVDEADEDIRDLILAFFGLIIANENICSGDSLLTLSVLTGLLEHCGYDVGDDILPLLSKLGNIVHSTILENHLEHFSLLWSMESNSWDIFASTGWWEAIKSLTRLESWSFNKLYIPQFVTVANGSTNFQEILDVIEKELIQNDLPSFSYGDTEVKEVQISGIPDNIEQILMNACGFSEWEWQLLRKRSGRT
ncbi:hypothetical protein L218DRAFT_1034277 [Marasmius fiardii PR-910]|nr:hypothetical protein L218DRAFT_1034277 [Marasmius fiardii PR-910]